MTDAQEPTQYVVERVRQALASDERVNELALDVKIAGGRIFVSGSVPTAERQAAIGLVVSELCPGYEVSNQTVVTRAPEPEEVEELT